MKQRIAALVAITGLAGCAPESVPLGASPDVSLKNGVVWYWQTETENGCVDWMATEQWVSTRVAVVSGCADRDSKTIFDAKGLRYSSSFDELTFHGYFEWSPEIWSELLVFDDKGMLVDKKPCPYELSQSQVDKMLDVVREAQNRSGTPHENAVLTRIANRLAKTDGSSLATTQHGCEHRPSEADWQDGLTRPNPWTDPL